MFEQEPWSLLPRLGGRGSSCFPNLALWRPGGSQPFPRLLHHLDLWVSSWAGQSREEAAGRKAGPLLAGTYTWGVTCVIAHTPE